MVSSFSFSWMVFVEPRLCRLLKEAPKFYDLDSWPEGAMRKDLGRASNRLNRKSNRGAAA